MISVSWKAFDPLVDPRAPTTLSYPHIATSNWEIPCQYASIAMPLFYVSAEEPKTLKFSVFISSKIITWSLKMNFHCSHCYYSHCWAFEEQMPPLFSLKTVSGSQSRKRGWAKNLKKFDQNLTKKRLSSPGHNSQVRWNIFKQTLGVPLFIPFEGI